MMNLLEVAWGWYQISQRRKLPTYTKGKAVGKCVKLMELLECWVYQARYFSDPQSSVVPKSCRLGSCFSNWEEKPNSDHNTMLNLNKTQIQCSPLHEVTPMTPSAPLDDSAIWLYAPCPLRCSLISTGLTIDVYLWSYCPTVLLFSWVIFFPVVEVKDA